MPVNVKSLHGRLVNIAREKQIDFQILVNRLAAEQFLYRLSLSPHAERFIFKGGSLLTYLIDSDRKTKDLDFSIEQLGNQVDEIILVIRSILDISVDDGIQWKEIKGESLNHPEMESPGVRLACRFLFGKMKGMVRMDMAFGDVVDAVILPVQRMQYRGQPLLGEAFSLRVYPTETVFAEKLHIAVKRRGQNTRMKDYYDLFKLVNHDLDRQVLKKSIEAVFTNRRMSPFTSIRLEAADLARLQTYWEHFLKREKMTEAPSRISEVIDKVNAYLKELDV